MVSKDCVLNHPGGEPGLNDRGAFMEFHILQVFLAALGAFVVYMITGGILFAAMPWLKTEFKKHPGVFREEADMWKVMPIGMLGMFVSMLALAVLYAHIPPLASALVQGACSAC